MSKIDELKSRIKTLQDELGVSYDLATYKDEIDSSSTYLLYKYMQLLELKDNVSVQKDLEGAGRLIEAIEKKDLDSLTAEEKSLIALKTDISSELDAKKSNIDEVTKKYQCEGEYSKIIWEPNSKYFSEKFMEEHREELDGIVDVNKETVELLQDENDKFFKDEESANNESEEETKTASDIEQITVDRINENYEVLGIIEYEFEDEETQEDDFETEEVIFPEEEQVETINDQIVTEEEALEVRERLQAHFEGKELTEEQKETIEELNYLFQMGRFDEYKVLAEAEINNEPVEEEEADPDVIEAMSDELIDQTIDKNFVASIEQEAEAFEDVEIGM